MEAKEAINLIDQLQDILDRISLGKKGFENTYNSLPVHQQLSGHGSEIFSNITIATNAKNLVLGAINELQKLNH